MGHINVSPKGIANCFHVVNSKQVWYEDLTGSGNSSLAGVETISHIRRIAVMFCAFEGPPRILRLFGVGTVHEYGSSGYNRLIHAATRKQGSPAVIVIDIYQVESSCGYAVPLYDFVMHRTQLLRACDNVENMDRMLAASRDRQLPDQEHDLLHAAESGDGHELAPPLSLHAYWLRKNMNSLDGLPGLLTAPGAILGMTPRSYFSKDAPRPMLRRSTRVITQPKTASGLHQGSSWERFLCL
ncbi:hypothetical protein J3R83DRAFT_9328 [Lanmaoa asiatica]|nr:hypothetical protein J3R83DRAFT_9328 [Lanmaoa asiatica]